MMYFSILLFTTTLCLLIPKATSVGGITARLRQKLDAEHQNTLCCQRNKKCCTRSAPTASSPPCPKYPAFEVKMVLVDCPPNTACQNCSGRIVVDMNKKKSTCCERVTNCQQKFLITININNYGEPRNNKSQYLVIDHVTDPQTKRKISILNPYVLRIRQAPLYQIYDLEFVRTVNSEAKEKVLRKRTASSSVFPREECSPSADCGLLKYNGKIVPFSDGFCCSCNSDNINKANKGASFEGQWPNSAGVEERGFSFGRLPDGGANKNSARDYDDRLHHGFIIGGHEDGDGPMSPRRLSGDDDGRNLMMGDRAAVYGGSQRHADESVNYRQFGGVKDAKYRRNDDARRVVSQRRGGQSCEDKSNPRSSFESTHCLTFSNTWYSVYELKKPRVEHRLHIQIYRKCEDCQGKTGWKDVTKGGVIDIGNTKQKYCNADETIAAKYEADEPNTCNSALNYKTQRLLIPEKRVVNPEQFLVVPTEGVSDGNSCDTAGVGFEAFYRQAKRCAQPPGSCLANQPRHMHEHDEKAERTGQRGVYFLKYFGTLPVDSVGRQPITGKEKNIKLLYTRNHTSSIYMEVEADYVTTITDNSLATITEIYVDATNPTKTKITVKVMNAGLTYGVFYVRMSGCPLEVPASFNNIATKSALIAPQDQHIYNLHIECPLLLDEFTCSIQVQNTNQELIAIRKMRVHKHDRCYCIWHCECSCYDTDRALKCTPLSLKDYQAAGFQGGMPVATTLVESSYLDEMLGLFFHMFIILVLTLLLMGLVKALLGCCSLEISMWGLDVILGHKTYDKSRSGPMTPNISFATQFCLNVVFFFIYPLALINMVIKKMCFSNATDESECNDNYRPSVSQKRSQRSSRGAAETTSTNSGSVRKRTTTTTEETEEEEDDKADMESGRDGDISVRTASIRSASESEQSEESRSSEGSRRSGR